MPEVFIEHNIDSFQRALALLPAEVTQRVMRQVADTAEREALRRYRRTASTWRHPPTFTAIKEVTPTSVGVLVGTDDEVYGYVDKGTKPHEIVPRAPGYPLRFQVGYQAKTIPGVLGSGAGGASGAEVRAMRVWHPGTEPRRFSEEIHKEMGPLVFSKTIDLIRKAITRHFRVWAK